MQKRRIKKAIFIILGFILFTVLCYIFLKWKLPIERTNYKSYEEYLKSGALASIEVPEGATDVRFYHNNVLLGKQSVYSFVISDDEEYNIFMEYLKDEICTEWGGTHPMWSNGWMPYCTYPYTEEEREEMTYLQENFMNMDYKEILSMSRHKYGFAYGYGASVVDYMELEYDLDRFPAYECLNEVMDDSLENYTILQYNPGGSGSSTNGIILNEESRRFVIFCFATIK